MIVIADIEQYDDEYWKLKAGRPSASQLPKIVTSTGKKSTSWPDMVFKFAAERETGKVEDSFSGKWTDRGSEMEAEAREAYSFIMDADVKEVGMVFSDERRLWLCSPDGLMESGGLEIKCPSQGVHKRYCHENKLPTIYSPQVWGSLWICDELEWWDFFSYHPDMKPFRIRVTREDEGYKKYVEALETFLPEFVKEIDAVSFPSIKENLKNKEKVAA